MNFASLMSAQIAKSKNPASASPEPSKQSKYLKRSEVEEQRQAAYVAEQKALEDARIARLDRKRKLDDEEAERNAVREEKRRRLAEESRKLREAEEEAEERKRRKRLGLPDLPVKADETEEKSGIGAENDVEDDELVKRLRDLDEPARLFGESHASRLRRYRRLAGLDESGAPLAVMTKGPIPTTLVPVPEAEMKVPDTLPTDAAGKDFLFRQLASYFTMVFSEWQIALARRDENVKTSFTGKNAYNAMVQAKASMVPLFRKLEKGELEDGILGPVLEIVRCCQERRYVNANDAYLRLSIGKAAWPIGVTMESYFTYGTEDESPVDHNVHFRAGIGADGSETFTPRAVLYDLKGAFGTLKRENALYDMQDDPSNIAQQMWMGNTNVIRHDPIPQSTYQEHLDKGLEPPELTTETVRFWSDYNRVYYHPRSIVQLNEYELNSALMPFERWSSGEDLFSDLDKEHDLLDRDLRPFLEECDQVQGLQIFTSTDDAWGGFAARYLDRIRDELGKTSAWVWGLEDAGRKSRQRQVLQTGNIAQSLYQISSQASMYIPLTTAPSKLPPYLSINSASRWHTSALQALSIETITLSTRLRANMDGRASLDECETVLSNDSKRKIATVGFSVANPAELDRSRESAEQQDSRIHSRATNGSAQDSEADPPELDVDLQPEMISIGNQRVHSSQRKHIFSQVECLRGKWKSAVEVEDLNLASRDRYASGPRIQGNQTDLLFPLLDSYPKIFEFEGTQERLAIRAALTTSASVAQRVRSVEALARSIVGIDEREALCDGLVGICEEYEDGWDSDESDDDL
ncbi:hypothetical protein MBLNU459_g4613t1 [Dothideomycetes sp. NU459]